MKPLARQLVGDYLEALSARSPAPGSGAVAALHAAQAAALLAMAAAYTTGAKYADSQDIVRQIAVVTGDVRVRALALADADVDALAAVGAAYAMPRETGPERDVRERAIAEALAVAACPHASVIELVHVLLESAERLLPIVDPSVITDLAAATEAARAAATTARLNVEINLNGITDRTLRRELCATLNPVVLLLARAARIEEYVRTALTR